MKGNEAADVVLSLFKSLPPRAKPRLYPNGAREWTPLCGIIISNRDEVTKKCVALGTGMRCLPANKIPIAKGRCLHDWHAEVVAIRAFDRYLLHECSKLSASGFQDSSEVIRLRQPNEKTADEPQPFAVKEGTRISMFCTEAPCGDASMELTMNAQVNAAPWTSQSRSDYDGMLQSGRGHFAELGAVRRKPARSDAPPTLSKSCSDKLALKQFTSLLSALTSLLIHPANAYLYELLLPEHQLVPTAIERAFSTTGRMKPITESYRSWLGGYSFHPFLIRSHERDFEFSRPPLHSSEVTNGSNIATVWEPNNLEVLIGGTKQGHKQFSQGGDSILSRRSLWRLALDVAEAMKEDTLKDILQPHKLYSMVKDSEALRARRLVKQAVQAVALSPWPRNDGDDFALTTNT